jgi:glycerol-3-phosphate dehydrogenase (NAD(P)+)
MMSDSRGHVAVIGAGAWGTTLARLLAQQGTSVRLWAATDELADEIESHRENVTFLPGFELPDGVSVSSDGSQVLDGAQAIIWVVPSAWLREVAKSLAPHVPDDALAICATKGIERGSGLRMSELLDEELGTGDDMVALSGPNLSREIAAGQPAVSVAACAREDQARQAQELLSTSLFRVYRNSDIMGVELCGALKNVIAIGAGISDGMGFGTNVRSALVTRGLAEMTRLGVAAGARPETFAGIAGMGDLLTTCTSKLSRNHTCGMRLAAGETREEIQASTPSVAEGIWTTVAEVEMAQRLGMEAPIAEAVHAVLFDGADPRDAAVYLMTREQRAEY